MAITILEESRGYSEAFGFRGVKIRAAITAETNPVFDISPITKILTFDVNSNAASNISGFSFDPESAPVLTLALGGAKTGTLFISVTGL